MPNPSDRVVMITGAAGNLGRAVAHAFQVADARLVLVDRSSGRLEKVLPELAASRYLKIENTDVADVSAASQAVAETVDHFGRLDVLVNAVGTFRGGAPLHETQLDVWRLLYDVNVMSTVIMCRAVIPQMIAQGWGCIVNVASKNAVRGDAGLAAYSATKSAVVRVTESLAAEVGDRGINVNCVLPGTMDTPQNRAAMPDADASTWVSPDDVADAILCLASDRAGAVHGAALPVFGPA